MLKVLYIIVALLILNIIVVVHEFGHYIFGRLCGIGVIEFSVGFGPKLLGKSIKGIQYSLRAIPIGGFCKFVGEDTDDDASNSMNTAKPWKKFLTVFAGPLMNFVFAFIVCVVLLSAFGYSDLLPKLDSVMDDMPAQAAGLMAGDTIIKANGTEISYDTEGVETLSEIINNAGTDSSVELKIRRGEDEFDTQITPVMSDNGETVTPMIGIQFSVKKNSFAYSIKGAGEMTLECCTLMVDALKNLITRGEGLDDMSGPVGIVTTISDYVNEGMYMILYFIFIISLNLGIMNLLPLPALDGGRLVFIIIEGIRGKKIPPEKEGLVHFAGFLLLLVLMFFVTYKDIVKLIAG